LLIHVKYCVINEVTVLLVIVLRVNRPFGRPFGLDNI
jgi:hypothetical protein